MLWFKSVFEYKRCYCSSSTAGLLWHPVCPGGVVSVSFGRPPLPPSALAVMCNRTYLSLLQLSFLIFAFSICRAVIWYSWGHWQLFLNAVKLSHDAGRQSAVSVSESMFYKIIPCTAVCPLTNCSCYFCPHKSSCTTSPNPWDNIRLHNWIRSGTCISRFYSETGDIWGLGVTRCFYRQSHWFWRDSPPESLLFIWDWRKNGQGVWATCLDVLECKMTAVPMAFLK